MISNREFYQLANRMICACKRLHGRGMLSGVGGNISLRTSEPNTIMCSPSGIAIMDMFPDDICLVDISDIQKDNYQILRAKHKPTSEIFLHGGIYAARPEVRAVIHSHPPMTTAFACTDKCVDYKTLEDQRWYIGEVESIPFVYSSSKALAEAALPKLTKNYALILKNHGVITLGDTLAEAVTITELLETLSQTYYYAQTIAGATIVRLPSEYWTDVAIEPRKDLIYQDEIFDERPKKRATAKTARK